MNRNFHLVLTLVLGALRAGAQPGPEFLDSLEAQMAGAREVFCGTISSFTQTTLPPQTGLSKYALTVRVGEVFKGTPGATATFFLQTGHDDRRVEQWADRHMPWLFINLGGNRGVHLNQPTGTPNPATEPWRFGGMIRLGDPVPAETGATTAAASPEYLWDDTLLNNYPKSLYSMAANNLSKPEEILACAREFAQTGFTPTNMDAIDLEGFRLTVPVGPWTETIARRMINSPVVASPEADRNGREDWRRNNRRVTGIKELRHFKSAANIEMLKPLLDDPGFQVSQIYRLVWEPKRHYIFRRAAYEVLRDWGVTVSEPVTEELLPWQYNPAARQKLVVQVPAKIGISLAGDEAVFWCLPNPDELTNVLTGSNMIVGATFEWRIRPAGVTLTNEVMRLESWFAPEAWSREEFKLAQDGLPTPGQKYKAALDFTLFETDQPPPDDNWVPQRNWHPGAGKNYRVLAQRKLEQTSK